MPVVVILWYLAIRRKFRVRRWFKDIRAHERISRPSAHTQERFRAFLIAGLLTALILAVAQPKVEVVTTEPVYRRQDAIFLLDVSPSMWARDVYPSRIDRAKEEMRNFIQDRGSLVDRVGLVTFAGNSAITSYLTRDIENVLFYLDIMEMTPQVSYGTDFSAALRGGLELVGKELEAAVRNDREDTNQKVFILLSDGEDFGPRLEDAIAATLAAGIQVYAVGIGAEHDTPIPVRAKNSDDLLRDEEGRVVSARFDESSLRRIALGTGGRYHRSHSGAELAEIVATFLEGGRQVAGQREVVEEVDLYPRLLMAGAVLLAFVWLI